MTVIVDTVPVSAPARWTGRILSSLVIVFLLFDGAIKLVPWPVVTETMDRMGYGSSETLARSLGAVTIVSLLNIPAAQESAAAAFHRPLCRAPSKARIAQYSVSR